MHHAFFQPQLQHLEWADARLWQATLATPAAADDARFRELVHHLHQVQGIYLSIWRGAPAIPSGVETFADLPAILRWAREIHRDLAATLAALPDEAWTRPLEFPWQEQIEAHFGAAPPATLAESVAQILLHTAHHRGQLCTRIRELGGEPPLVDFIAWIWQRRPAPAWPDPVPLP